MHNIQDKHCVTSGHVLSNTGLSFTKQQGERMIAGTDAAHDRAAGVTGSSIAPNLERCWAAYVSGIYSECDTSSVLTDLELPFPAYQCIE
jgi:hypothetical protein